MVGPSEIVEGVQAEKPNPFERLLGRRRAFPYDRPEVDFTDPRPYEKQLFDQVGGETGGGEERGFTSGGGLHSGRRRPAAVRAAAVGKRRPGCEADSC
jgi:hypothetical protein